MPAHKPLSQDLLAAARRGDLKRSNTAPGTPERRAVDRITYIRRIEKHPGGTAREALGHHKFGKTGGRISSLLDGAPEYVVLENATRSELRRAGRYERLVRELLDARITKKEFIRKIKSWKPIRGRRFLADPKEIYRILDKRREDGLPLFEYEAPQ